ncbi:MAG: PAS domain S-box protein [Alphaproteobacteria bacterium]|nr:PAS domain S-box protein [Alphaproteobacteria bacterium]
MTETAAPAGHWRPRVQAWVGDWPRALAARAFWGRFVRLAVPLLLGLLTVFVSLELALRQDTLADIAEGESLRVGATSQRLTRDFHAIVSDINVLARSPAVTAYLAEPTAARRTPVEAFFTLFSAQRGLYDQIRLIDSGGEELVRVDHARGAARLVPQEDLQNKAQRYYVRDALELPPGSIYLSRFDLNVEHGEVERPLKPMIRFAMPLADQNGRTAALLVMNYYGAFLLDTVRESLAGTPGHALLLNRAGFWLEGPDARERWGFMFDRDRTFGDAHPDLWTEIGRAPHGQVRGDGGLLTWTTVDPVALTRMLAADASRQSTAFGTRSAGAAERWTLATLVPADVLATRFAARRTHYGALFVVLPSVILALSLVLAYARWHEHEMRRAVDRAATVMDVTGDGVIILDAGRRILSVNPAFTRALGWPAAEVVGRPCASFVAPADRPVLDVIWQRVESEGSWTGEVWRPRRDGRPFPTRTTVSAVRLDGRTTGFVVIFADITDEKERDMARLKAEEDSRAKTRFLASMSHELRTPLNSIIGFSDIIATRLFGDRSERYAAYGGYIRESGEHLLALINDILDISKIEAGKLELDPRPLDLPALLADGLRLVAPQAEAAHVAVRLDLPEPAPALTADERAIKQIIVNLLSNAVRFTPADGRVTVQAAAVPGAAGRRQVEISVADTGVGIPFDQIERILQPFEQADNRYAHAPGGSGLGLALVKGLVDLHDGTLEIASAPGRGTEVTIRLPATS